MGHENENLQLLESGGGGANMLNTYIEPEGVLYRVLQFRCIISKGFGSEKGSSRVGLG